MSACALLAPKVWSFLLLLVWAGGASSTSVPKNSHGCPTSDKAKFLVHYKLSYAEPGSRQWNWSSEDFDRFAMGCNSTEHPAAHVPPADGALASADPEHIDSDMALMKQYCIDGVILDYQTMASKTGAAIMHEALLAVIDGVSRAGLEFAIMYDAARSEEDWDWGLSQPDKVRSDWKEIIGIARNHSAYLRDRAGNLMFFTFGPTPAPSDAVPCENCVFYSKDAQKPSAELDKTSSAVGLHGSYDWTTLHREPLEFASDFYKKRCSSAFPEMPVPCVGGAYAGFKSVSKEGTVPRTQDLLRDMLELCVQHTEFCQIQTWNDFTEGTNVVPSHFCDSLGPIAYLEVVREVKISSSALPHEPSRRPSRANWHFWMLVGALAVIVLTLLLTLATWCARERCKAKALAPMATALAPLATALGPMATPLEPIPEDAILQCSSRVLFRSHTEP